MSFVVERRIRCPFCTARMDVVLDLSAGSQSYVEDCQICCQPMQITFETDSEQVLEIDVSRAG